MRHLATIQKIEQLRPIEGADRIETALMHNLGWECIVKKNEFKVGDIVIYVEIDSVLPDKPEFEFMKSRKFRVKTIKLKGQVSQGLILPITLLDTQTLKVNMDVTKQLGIVKYDPEAILEQKQANKYKSLKWIMMHHKFTRWLMKYDFINKLVSTDNKEWPSWVSKTDEERIQSMPQVLETFKDATVYITEKVDGQSATYTSKSKRKFIIASRNRINTNPTSTYGRIAKTLKLNKVFRSNFSPHTVLQGEILGPKVQGNKYGKKDLVFLAYNFINSKGSHADYFYMSKALIKYGILTVPFIKECKLSDIGTTVAEWVEFSKGTSMLNLNTLREGIVVRVVKDGRKLLSFKVINPDFILKYKL